MKQLMGVKESLLLLVAFYSRFVESWNVLIELFKDYHGDHPWITHSHPGNRWGI